MGVEHCFHGGLPQPSIFRSDPKPRTTFFLPVEPFIAFIKDSARSGEPVQFSFGPFHFEGIVLGYAQMENTLQVEAVLTHKE